MPPSKSNFRLVGSDKAKDDRKANRKRRRDDVDTPESLHFPTSLPWGNRADAPEEPADILDSIERTIDRAKEALDRLEKDADVLYRFADENDEDDDRPSAA